MQVRRFLQSLPFICTSRQLSIDVPDPFRAGELAILMDCWRYLDYEILVHDFVRDNMDEVCARDLSRIRVDLTDIQYALLGKLSQRILWKLCRAAESPKPESP